MELLYIYIKDYRCLKEKIFNFSEEYIFSHKDNKILIKRAGKKIKNFYSKDFSNITVIVGKNGTGKTTLLNAIYSFVGDNVYFQNAIALKIKNEIFIYVQSSCNLEFDNENSDINAHIGQYDQQDLTNLDELVLPKIYYSSSFGNQEVWFARHGCNISNVSLLNAAINENSNNQSRANVGPYQYYRRTELIKQVNFIDEFENKLNLPFFDALKNIGVYFLMHRLSNKESFEKSSGIFESKYAIDLLNRIMAEPNDIDSDRRFEIRKSDLKIELILFIAIHNFVCDVLEENADINFYNDALLLLNRFFENGNTIEMLAILDEFDKNHFLKPIKEFYDYIDTIADKISDCSISTPISHNLRLNIDTFQFFINRTCLCEFYDKYQKTLKKSDYLDFHWEISSGENAYLNLFSRLNNVKNSDKITVENHLWLLIDEGETFLHPEWSKGFIKNLIENLPLIFPKKKIHLFLTTHSPFMLSDVLANGVICFDKENGETILRERNNESIRTFAQNINALYSDSFFVEGAFVGDFAKKKIMNVIDFLNTGICNDDSIKNDNVLYLIEQIGEPIIRKRLLEMYNNKRKND